jgi:hypothetical protein
MEPIFVTGDDEGEPSFNKPTRHVFNKATKILWKMAL